MTLRPEKWETKTRAIQTALIKELSRLNEKYSIEKPKTYDFFGARVGFDENNDLKVDASFDDTSYPAIFPIDDRTKEKREAVFGLLHLEPQPIAYVTEQLLQRSA